jgi:hypothetical protein
LGDGAKFAAALFIGLMIVMTVAVAGIAETIALQGCAICDNNPPNYIAAAMIGTAAILLLWFMLRVLIRLFGGDPHSDRENSR